ncbi:MAG: ribosome biogenesis GTPase YlqF, partial [Clostridiales bacterium]|nr:ribosome biogenesis GTPase YlqF [Clostridiales bacterium]
TRELIQSNLKMVDVVVEIIDSRIPMSSRNPIIDELIAGKRRIVVLGKSDLADETATKEWKTYFENEGNRTLALNLQSGENIKLLLKALESEQTKRNEEKSFKRPLRLMIVGVPNVGKSSLINRLIGRKSTQTGNRPGVAKGKQWVTLKNGMQLLDTPGILWPKFDDPNLGLNLAFCGSLKDDILGVADLAFELIKFLEKEYPENLISRYGIDEISEETIENMDAIALKRGFIMAGKRIDYDRTGRNVLDEFRSGLLGKITLEKVK